MSTMPELVTGDKLCRYHWAGLRWCVGERCRHWIDPDKCALDYARRGGMSTAEVAAALGMTEIQVLVTEARALRQVCDAVGCDPSAVAELLQQEGLCSVPGCTAALRPLNVSGLCRWHRLHHPHTEAPRCAGGCGRHVTVPGARCQECRRATSQRRSEDAN